MNKIFARIFIKFSSYFLSSIFFSFIAFCISNNVVMCERDAAAVCNVPMSL